MSGDDHLVGSTPGLASCVDPVGSAHHEQPGVRRPGRRRSPSTAMASAPDVRRTRAAIDIGTSRSTAGADQGESVRSTLPARLAGCRQGVAEALASAFFDFDVPVDVSALAEDVVAVESDDDEVVVESLVLSAFESAFFFDDLLRLSVL